MIESGEIEKVTHQPGKLPKPSDGVSENESQKTAQLNGIKILKPDPALTHENDKIRQVWCYFIKTQKNISSM